MPALNQAHANNIIDASLGTAAFVATSGGVQVRLMSTNGTATTGGTQVTNAGGSTYTPQVVTFAAASGGSAASSGTLNFTNMPAITVNGVEIWDQGGTPARKWFGALSTPKTTNLGDTFQIQSGSLTAALT